ncbi:hypothetical protein [Clostridium thermarum]|uniref:hypothetical protein n=1 Tax=Clostridium thermarum TaxID=1716543 RepID=UPI0013CFABF3|nr:hypothetical protein [Clostridium thermarum]
MKKKDFAIGVAAATVVVGASVYAGIKLLKKKKAQKVAKVVSETKIISLDFPRYETLKDLYNNSEIVIRGQILDTGIKEIHVGDHEDGEPIEYLYTVSRIKILKVIKGNIQEGDIIFVKQLGDGKKVIANGFDEDRYFKPQEEYYLFLETFGKDSVSMPYSCVNLKQASFKVDSGIISSEHINIAMNTGYLGESVTAEEFEAQLGEFN